MSITIPPELQQAVVDHAAKYRVTVDESSSGEAIIGDMRVEKELLDEFEAWEQVSDECFGESRRDVPVIRGDIHWADLPDSDRREAARPPTRTDLA